MRGHWSERTFSNSGNLAAHSDVFVNICEFITGNQITGDRWEPKRMILQIVVPPYSIGIAVLVWAGSLANPLAAQAPAAKPIEIAGINVSGSLRTRFESWDWFSGGGNSNYTYPASIMRLSFTQSRKSADWQIEFALPFLLLLPDNAIGPGSQGQLGFGGSYFAANGRHTNAAMLFPKQSFVRFNEFAGVEGQSVKLGRMEFIDGAEVSPEDSTLAALKRDRIANRLLGNFAFSDVGRSFDGVLYSLSRPKWNVTVLAARPTRGVFQVDGWGELKADVFYGALTGQLPGRHASAEWRVFGIGYIDDRDSVVKTDNRPLALRTADANHIDIETYGGHYLQTVRSSYGAIDLLAWGALQRGSWGRLAQRSGAVAIEAGWQPRIWRAVHPWVRVGYDYGSGDSNPNDGTHGTFFQVLPTPRVYARFPFFNMMNNRDVFGELMLRLSKGLTVRSDAHSLALASRNDLWYSGGGMFQPWTFGYTGRPSNGHSSLANLYDVSTDYSANQHLTIGLYYGHAAGKLVVQSLYPGGKTANFGCLELTFRM